MGWAVCVCVGGGSISRYALQHNLGLGGAVVVTLYRKGFPNVPAPSPTSGLLGYNAATECRGISAADLARCVARRARGRCAALTATALRPCVLSGGNGHVLRANPQFKDGALRPEFNKRKAPKADKPAADGSKAGGSKAGGKPTAPATARL